MVHHREQETAFGNCRNGTRFELSEKQFSTGDVTKSETNKAEKFNGLEKPLRSHARREK